MKYLLVFLVICLFSALLAAQTKVPPSSNNTQSNFAAVTMDGTKIDTAALRGKIVVINLWFINCPNCVQEIKMLNQLVDEYKDNKDVVFLGLAASKKAELEKFLKKNPFKYQVVPDAAMIIFSKFGTPNRKGEIDMPFPMHYVLDREGMITVKIQGTKGVEAVKTDLKKQFMAKTATVK